MSGKELSSVAYKKGNWLRYTLWAVAAVCIIFLIVNFFNMINGTISATVPDGYKFSVTDDYDKSGNIRTTYYVYDDRIMVEDESFTTDTNNRIVMVYDDINTDSLTLDTEDTVDICELGSCHTGPKVLLVIKKLTSRQNGREYIGI